MRKLLLVVATATMLFSFAGAAGAGPPGQTTGVGKLHFGAGFTFVAFSDLRGFIQYQSTSGLSLQCGHPTVPLASYTARVSKQGYHDATFASNDCWDPQGNLYRVWVDAMDRGAGEGARLDKVTLRVYTLPDKTLLIEERGTISAGTVQVLL